MNRLRLTQSRGSGTFSVKTLYLPESSLYRPLLDMCHKVEENALKSYNNMSYNCGLDLELFIPMFQMYELLGTRFDCEQSCGEVGGISQDLAVCKK